MYRPAETLESRLGVVVRDDLGTRRPPLASYADSHGRIRLDVEHVASVAPELGDDPAGRVFEVHPHDGASLLPRAPSDALEQDIARYEAHAHREHCRRVQEVPLKE